MKTFVTLVAVAATAALLATAARGDGSPFAPGLVYGASGVRPPHGPLRYVTLATQHSTLVAAISVRNGLVVRSAALPGFYGSPSSRSTTRPAASQATGKHSSSLPTGHTPAHPARPRLHCSQPVR